MGLKDNPIVFLTRKMWEYSEGNRSKVILYTLLFAFASGIDFLYPLLLAKILNIIQESGITSANIYTLIGYLSFYVILDIIFWCFWKPGRIIERTNAFLVEAKYKKDLLDGTMNLPAEWHTDHHSGDTIDKIEKGTQALYRYSESSFEIIESVLRFIGSFIALAYFNFHSIYIIIFMTFISINIIFKMDKVLIKQYTELNHAKNNISAKVFDIISNITTVIILRIERLVSKMMYKKIMKAFPLFKKNAKLNETKWAIVSILNAVMLFAVLTSYVLGALNSGTTIMVGTLSALYAYVQRIVGLFFRFTWKYSDIVRQRTAVANAEEISDEFKKIKRTKKGLLKDGWNKLRIEKLNFSYSTKKGDILNLQGIEMTIKRGEKIALIGESGSGKTTFLKVIRELYPPQFVNLYLDGKLLKNDFRPISPDISLIPQDPEIFCTSIKENITLGAPYKLKEVKKYTDISKFTKVAENLPKGFDSSIVEKGVNLSGGEKQRLALARGLLASKNKAIVLLDEPTSSVDPKNELEIYKSIFTEFKEKTVISSIHRLHLLSLFDYVYLFKDGKIISSGTFEELKRKSPEFKDMWRKYTRSQRLTGK